MPIAEDQMTIPSELPEILKQFTRDAINTQPSDLLEWSYMYFSALKNGTKLPTEDCQKRSSISKWATLSPEILKELHKKLGGRLKITSNELIELWNDLGLPPDLYSSIMLVGCLSKQIEWLKFLALACSALGVTIARTLKIACEVLSEEDSGPPSIQFSTFQFLYSFLAEVDGEVLETQVHQMLSYLEQQVVGPDGLIKVSDFIDNPNVRLE
ncbi:ropporin-1-like isoform X1 [Bufo bufo]|uniref:ropporin-1-like isoform X1 n=1 Tax=Bufo bufo TaxID=8384 RepID=UPI001ABE2FF7|nr:ropporin-1-like isoform X1 [Bufo bufo]